MTYIAVVGSGSVFSSELVVELSKITDQLGELTLRFFDIDQERQDIVSGLCRRLLKDKKDVTIVDCKTLEECLPDASFVLLQIRHGGIDARIEDEKLGKKYKLPFTETISICGISTFIRTYYEYEKIGPAILKHAPDALVLNFTNPSAQLTETLYGMGIKNVMGVCNGFMSMKDVIKHTLNDKDSEYFMNWRGLNHLTVVDGIFAMPGNNFSECKFYPENNKIDEVLANLPDWYSEFEHNMLQNFGALLNGYFQYYFNRRNIIDKLQKQDKVRSEIVKEIDEALLEEFKTAETVPPSISKRGGYGYATAVVNIIEAYCSDEATVHYASVRNGKCLPSLPASAFVEVPVLVSRDNISPIQTGDMPDFARSLAIAIKDYERMLIKAAKKRDKAGMLRAMMTHPLLNCYSVAKPLLDDCLEINRAFLPMELTKQ